MALKQRRGSIAFRINGKLQLPEPSTVSHISEESKANIARTYDEPSAVPYTNGNQPENEKYISPEIPMNGHTSPRPTLKASSPNPSSKKALLSTEKNSTSCTIQ